MTPRQILDRLNAEFPKRHVNFTLEVTTFTNNVEYSEPEDPQTITMYLWDSGGTGASSRVPCNTLEEGIAAMKVKLGMQAPQQELTV